MNAILLNYKKCMKRPRLYPVLCFIALTHTLFALHKTFPEGLVIDITQAPYNADNRGKQDVTEIIQRAINENRDLNHPTTLYFPAGVYKVSNTILTLMSDTKPSSRGFLTFQGENEQDTVIRLEDYSPGFQNAEVPKPLFNAACPTPNEDKFQNNFFDLTIDVGMGNPAAIGLSYRIKPQAAISNVTIRSTDPRGLGRCGLSVCAPLEPASAFFKNLTIEGFNYGVQLAPRDYCLVLENLTLRRQNKAGLENHQNVCAIYKVNTEGEKPALVNSSQDGVLTVVDGHFKGGATEAAIVNKGELYVRDVHEQGYQTILLDKGMVFPGERIKEHASGTSLTLFDVAKKSLNLPVKATPEVVWDDPKHWVNVADFGAIPNDGSDDSAAIQAAIDSMEDKQCTLYLPHGVWTVERTIVLRGNVRRVFGNFAHIRFKEPEGAQQLPLFRVENTRHPILVVERLMVNTEPMPEVEVPKGYLFENHRKQTLVLKHIWGVSQGLYLGVTPGEAFMEEVACSSPVSGKDNVPMCYFYPHEQVWARYMSAQSDFTTLINDGATVWMLGYSTDKTGVQLDTRDHARTEIIGAFVYSSSIEEEADVPTFSTEDSDLSLLGAKVRMRGRRHEATFFARETQGNKTRDLVVQEVGREGNETTFAVPMMVAAKG